jgi:hypothetical protein
MRTAMKAIRTVTTVIRSLRRSIRALMNVIWQVPNFFRTFHAGLYMREEQRRPLRCPARKARDFHRARATRLLR